MTQSSNEGTDMITAAELKIILKRYPSLVAAKRSTFRMLEALYAGVVICIKAGSHLAIFNSKLVRKIAFDVSDQDTFLISSSGGETFIHFRRDKGIGRDQYTWRGPTTCEFHTMQRIVSILGEFRPTRLIDVGANIGTVCIPAVKRGLFGTAIAIEPEPKNYSLLMANIYINGLSDRIITYNLALGPQDDQSVVFELSEDKLCDHRVHVESDMNLCGESTRELIKVKSETFDKIVKTVESNNTLIWIDTQGFEGHVL
jgi:FkbM family methyltransferase